MNQKYIEILNTLIEEKIGENLFEVKSNKEDTRISINIINNGGVRGSCCTIPTENGYFILNCFDNTFRFNSTEMFKEMSLQIVEDLKPTIIEYYKRKAINSIPKKLNIEIPKVDFSLINADWIIKKFKEASLEESNGEEMLEPEITIGGETLSIKFKVDCNRRGVHKRNNIYINDTGHINIDLCEALEGGGIEDHLENNIKKLLKIK